MPVQLNNLYKTPFLPGDCLCQPLKKYNQFFADHINNNTGCAKTAYKIARVVCAIVVYPLAGTLAGIGLIVKYTRIPKVIRKNNDMKEGYREELANATKGFINGTIYQIGINSRLDLNWGAGEGTPYCDLSKPLNSQYTILHTFDITEENYRNVELINKMFTEVDQEIDKQTDAYCFTAFSCRPMTDKIRMSLYLGQWCDDWRSIWKRN